ncbi:phosphoribosyl-AMP cyclohydrolase [Nanoarchaeota archaeon]
MIKLDFDKMGGLLPVIVQDYKTNEVRMLGFMNQEAFLKTLETKEAWFWSRTRNVLWHKGSTSGQKMNVKQMFTDCDDDTLILKVEQVGGISCHKGKRSCFFKEIKDGKVIEGE